MVVQKNSPSRRKSIAVAVTDGGNPDRPKKPRRAHSVAPSEISPLTRSRLSLGPVKGILKSVFRRTNTEPLPETSTSSRATASNSTPQRDDDATVSMDITQDYQAKIHDNFARKSMNRRVSFNEVLSVREFRPPQKNDTVSSQGSNGPDQSSDDLPSSDAPGPEPVPPPANNENDYPGASQRISRRSSIRQSLASDMELTQVYQDGDASSLDQPFSDEDEDNMTMDVTQAMAHVVHRRSSVRPPLAQAPTQQSASEERSYEEDNSQMSVESGQSECDQSQVDYQAKLAHSLRPAETDPQWVALRDLANGGRETVTEEEDDSLQLDTSGSNASEDSILGGNGDETVNLTKLMARRSSVGSGLMDVTSLYGGLAPDMQSTPRPSLAAPESSSPAQPAAEEDLDRARITERLQAASSSEPSTRDRVFSIPPSPSKTSTTPRPASPSRPRPSFTAAFAPPVSRPSPKRPTTPTSASGDSTPKKRPRTFSFNSENEGPNGESSGSAKRPSVARNDSAIESSNLPRPKPLSPSKKAPFRVQTNNAEPPQPQRTTLRRPSGYLASRRSMGGPATQVDDASTVHPPQKKTFGLGMGRASVGPGYQTSRNRRESDSRVASFEKERQNLLKARAAEAAQQRMEEDGDPTPTSSPKTVPSTASANEERTPEAPQPEPLDEVGVEEEPEMQEAAMPTPQADENMQLLDEDDDTPPISIEQFLEMTGIRFMDELTVPRRSIYPSDYQRTPRAVEDIPMAETAIAIAIDAPQLVLYSRVCQDLEAWMEKSKAEFRQAEEEAAKVTPELFVEYSKVDEESQEELKGQLKLIRKHSRGLAKSDWYNWKLQWIEGLIATANKAFAELEADAKSLETFLNSPDDPIPDLEREYQEVLDELEREQAEVAASEACDQQYLVDLKASISEQNIEVDALRTEVNDGKEQVSWLKQRIQEIHKEAHATRSAITDSDRVLHIRQQDTSALYKLTDELEALQDLYMFKALKVMPDVFKYVISSQYQITIPCHDFVPRNDMIDIRHTASAKAKFKDDFPRLTSFLLESVQNRIRRERALSVKQIVQTLADYCSSFAQIRTQLRHITIKFPVNVEVSAPAAQPRSFSLNAMLLFPSVKGKAIVSLTFDENVFLHWPHAIKALRWGVSVAYGAVNRDALYNALTERISQATPQDNFGCLLDACIEAQEAI